MSKSDDRRWARVEGESTMTKPDDKTKIGKLMRAGVESLDKEQQQATEQIGRTVSLEIWKAVEAYQGQLAQKFPMSPMVSLAAALRSVFLGSLAATARCGRMLGMSDAEFVTVCRDRYQATHLMSHEIKPGLITCVNCGNPATCRGVGEAHHNDTIAAMCDDCCGHVQSDGWCKPIDEPESEESN